MTWRVDSRAPLDLDQEIASSTKLRARRWCTSRQQAMCIKAVSSTNPWQMLYITRPRPPSRVALVDDSPHSLSWHRSQRDRHRFYQNLVDVLPECSSVGILLPLQSPGTPEISRFPPLRRGRAEGGAARRVESVRTPAEMDHRGREGLVAHASIFWSLLSGLSALCGRRRCCQWWWWLRRRFWRRCGPRIFPLRFPPRASSVTALVAATTPF